MKLIQPSQFYVLRKPAFPTEIIFDLLSIENVCSFQEKIKTIFKDSAFKNAIFTSSPSLYHQLSDLQNEDNVTKKERMHKTLLKYLTRMCTRSTPYGGFAGCVTAGDFAGKTAINFKEGSVRHKRLDAKLLLEIQRYIVDHPEIKAQLKFSPNNSLYKIGKKLKYTYYSLQNNSRAYSLCSFESNPFLDAVLSFAKSGVTIDSMVGLLLCDDIGYEAAESFILELISEQILVSELEFRVTGDDFLEVMIQKLASLKYCEELMNMLKQINLLLNNQEDEVCTSEKIRAILITHQINPNSEVITHTDLYFQTSENTIKKSVVDDLAKNFQDLLAINQAHYNYDLENFKRKFRQRYEEEEIPLLVALDGENGIGYGSMENNENGHLPLLDNMNVSEGEQRSTIEWNFWKDFLLKKYTESLLDNMSEIKLREQDLIFLKEHNSLKSQVPSSFSAFGSLIASSQEGIDKNEFMFNLNLISGPSGANIISRFCNGDEDLKDRVKTYLKAEEESYPDALVAEIIHLPEEVAGNILARPALRNYEIPFLANSSVDSEHQIMLDDIMVSIKNGKEVILRSKKLNKRIIPRLSTTHNFLKGLGVYKFLCDIQYDDHYVNIRWHWSILEKQKFLPRVSYKNIILSRATWNFTIDEFPQLKNQNIRTSSLFPSLNNKYQIPRYVSLCESDNELLLDLQNEYCKTILIEELIKRGGIVLKEYLQTPDNCFLNDSRGSYTNEIVIPFENKEKITRKQHFIQPAAQIKRRFSLGSEWLYFKIYTGEKAADKLLKSDLQALVAELKEDGLIDKWFFCRYSDPDYHIRLRFHGNPEKEFYKEVTKRTYGALDQYIQTNLIHKVQTDTYNREVERYGDDTIELMEDLFHNDSNAIMALLHLLKGDSGENARWLFALRGINALMEDFNCSLTKKLELVDFLQNNFGNEFKGIYNLKKQADDKFRSNARQIEEFFEEDMNIEGIGYQVKSILDQRSQLNKDKVDAILNTTAMSVEKSDNLLISYMHMFLNRMFLSKHRLQEYMIYHHLSKYYRGVLGKKKQILQA